MHLPEQVESLCDAPLLAGAVDVARRLRTAGHRALWVGGCVRDALLRLPLKDIDIATDARPEQVTRLFEGSRLVGATFGVVVVPVGERQYDVATFRRDGTYVDFRHPASVEFGSLEDDSRRRDFTMNAIYFDTSDGSLVDPQGGVADIAGRLLRCVGNPRDRFSEDALRLLRAVRFASRLGLTIDGATSAAMRDLAPNVQYLSPERVRDELTAMLTGPAPSRAIRLLEEHRLLEWVLPEVAALHGVEQGAMHHPEGDVFKHTMLCIDRLEPKSPILAWATLLHDIGKPATFRRWEDGGISFYDHEKVGADIARSILARLRFPADFTDRVALLVSRHMRFLSIEQMRTSTLRRFLGSETIEEDLALHRADCLGSSGRLDYHDFARRKMAEFRDAGEHAMPPPFVTGDDLIALGVPPARRLGRLLRELHDEQLEGRLTSREQAIERARELLDGTKEDPRQ